MAVLSVAVVHGRRGVELAGGEELLLVHPLVRVVRDLPVPRPRRDYGDAGPGVQERPVRSARARRCSAAPPRSDRGEAAAIARTSGSSFGVSVGGRSSITSSVASKSGSSASRLARMLFEPADELLVGLGRGGADVQGDVGARRDDVDLGLPAVGSEQDRRRKARVARGTGPRRGALPPPAPAPRRRPRTAPPGSRG